MTDTRSAHPVPGPAEELRDPATTIKLIVAWLWVGIPAAWGVWHVFRTSLKLFQ